MSSLVAHVDHSRHAAPVPDPGAWRLEPRHRTVRRVTGGMSPREAEGAIRPADRSPASRSYWSTRPRCVGWPSQSLEDGRQLVAAQVAEQACAKVHQLRQGPRAWWMIGRQGQNEPLSQSAFERAAFRGRRQSRVGQNRAAPGMNCGSARRPSMINSTAPGLPWSALVAQLRGDLALESASATMRASWTV